MKGVSKTLTEILELYKMTHSGTRRFHRSSLHPTRISLSSASFNMAAWRHSLVARELGACCDRGRGYQQPQSFTDDGQFLERLFRYSTGENPLSFRTDVVPPEVIQLLSRSARILEPLPEAYLAGGTALALHLSHRISVDLDFFVPQAFLAGDLRPRLIDAGKFTPITVRDDSIVCRIDTVQWSLFKYE
jgi:hypothetical protein